MTNVSQILLVCLCDRSSTLLQENGGLRCSNSGCHHTKQENAFPVVDSVPVIISETITDTVCRVRNTRTYVPRSSGRLQRLAKLLQGTSELTKRNCDLFVSLVRQSSNQPRILVIGAGTEGSGSRALWAQQDLTLIGVDIYISPTVNVVCDAHYLPFPTETFDGVWIQAVLEHVVEPIKVVSELERVLKVDGIVYAETPFLQPVHEGAYDFTRFTVLGHRYLFRKFMAIDYGGNKGAEVALAWSIRYLTWALLRSRLLARMAGVLAGIVLRPLKNLTSKKSLFDSSAGVFFLGRKAIGYQLSHAELISLYKGNQ